LAFNKFRRSGLKEDFINYKRISVQAKNFFKDSKRRKWDETCLEVRKDSSLNLFWKMTNHFKNPNSSRHKYVDSVALEALADKLAPAWVCNDAVFCPEDNDELQGSNTSASYIAYNFSLNELKFAIANSKNTAAGLDNINFKIIKNLPSNFNLYILHLFNHIFEVGRIPDEWRLCKIVPIKKSNGVSLRPISLLICLRKLFEKMIYSRLEWWCENEKILSDQVHGFRRGRGVADCLNELFAVGQTSLIKKNAAVALFLDIASAFDTVNIDILCERLKELHCPMKVTKILITLMGTRLLHFDTTESHFIRKTNIGLPQGSILSPILFNIFISDLISVIEPDCFLIQYADDIVLYASEKNWLDSEIILQNSINSIMNWSLNKGLDFSAEKSSVMVFTRKHTSPEVHLELNGRMIKVVDNIRYLGVIWDRKLLWNLHIDHICSRSKKYLNIIRAISGTKWGCDPASLTTLYCALIRSCLEFFPPALLSCSLSHCIRVKRIQWCALRLSLGCMKSTATAAMEVLSGVPPLDIRVEFLQKKFFIKCFMLKKCTITNLFNNLYIFKPSHKLCSIFYEIKLKNIRPTSPPWFNLPLLLIPFRPAIDLSYKFEMAGHKLNLSQTEHRCIYNGIISKYCNASLIFTDGSRSDNFVGSAMLHYGCISQGWKLKNASIFEAEAFGILKAIVHIKSVHPPGRFAVLSDSLSVIHSISSSVHPAKLSNLVLEIRKILFELVNSGYVVTLIWVPSHVGIQGNEDADRLAALANNGVEGADAPSIVLFFRAVFLNSKEIWQERWASEPTGSHLRLLYPLVGVNTWFRCDKGAGLFSRREFRLINRMATGHTMCNEHLFRIGVVDSEDCDCGAIQTINHLLWDCPHIDRKEFEEGLAQLNLAPPWDYKQLFAACDYKLFKIFVDFLITKDIKI
jgi:ribonuclease HI